MSNDTTQVGECESAVCTSEAATRDWSQVLGSLWFNLAVGSVFFLLFGLLRGLLPVYKVRSKHPRAMHAFEGPGQERSPGPLAASQATASSTESFISSVLYPFAWVADVLSVSETTMFDICGMDALYYDRSMRLAMKLFSFIVLVVISVILPTNFVTSKNHLPPHIDPDSIEGQFDRTTIAFIPERSPVLWLHVLVIVAVTAWVMFLLNEQYRLFLEERHALYAGSVSEQISQSSSTNSTGTSQRPSRRSMSANVLTNSATQSVAEHIAHVERQKHAYHSFEPEQEGRGKDSRSPSKTTRKRASNPNIEQQGSAVPATTRASTTSADDIETGLSEPERAALLDSSWAKEKTMLPQSHVVATNSRTGDLLCVKPHLYAALIVNAKPSKAKKALHRYASRYLRILACFTRGLHGKSGTNHALDMREKHDWNSKWEEIEGVMQMLFPDTFVCLIPVLDHMPIHQLRMKRHVTLKKYERALERSAFLEGSEAIKASSNAVQLHAELQGLSEQIEHDQVRLLESRKHPTTQFGPQARQKPNGTQDSGGGADKEGDSISQPSSFFALFSDQASPAIATQATLRPGSGTSWHAVECPAINDIQWSSLWVTQTETDIRRIIVGIAVVGVYIFPVGAFSALLGGLSSTLCDTESSPVYWKWYCRNDDPSADAMRRLIEVYLPGLLLVLWNGVGIPRLFYLASLSRRKSVSMSGIDKAVYNNFFIHAVCTSSHSDSAVFLVLC